MAEYFRVNDPHGADLREIVGDARGKYLGDRKQLAPQGWIHELDSKFTGRSSVSDQREKNIVKFKDKNGLCAGIEEELGEICHECFFRSHSGQLSGSDFQAALTPSDVYKLEVASIGDTIVVYPIIVLDNILVDPRISFIEFMGTNYEIQQTPLNVGPLKKGNSVEVIVIQV